MEKPVRGRGLTEQEGRKLQHTVRRGSPSSVRSRRATMLLASAGGSTVPVMARLVQADEDTVRDVIHKFNATGSQAWTLAGREAVPAFSTVTTRTSSSRRPPPARPSWASRSPAGRSVSSSITCDETVPTPVPVGREALRCLLAGRGISFQGTKTWKESPDLDFDTKPARIECAINERPDRTFAFDEFGPLGIRPSAGSCWAEQTRALYAYLRRRNQNARHPDVLTAQRRERARIRSQRSIRWGGRPLPTVA